MLVVLLPGSRGCLTLKLLLNDVALQRRQKQRPVGGALCCFALTLLRDGEQRQTFFLLLLLVLRVLVLLVLLLRGLARRLLRQTARNLSCKQHATQTLTNPKKTQNRRKRECVQMDACMHARQRVSASRKWVGFGVISETSTIASEDEAGAESTESFTTLRPTCSAATEKNNTHARMEKPPKHVQPTRMHAKTHLRTGRHHECFMVCACILHARIHDDT